MAPGGDAEKAHAASANTEHFNQGSGSERACKDFISLIMKWDICALQSQTHRHGLVRRRLRQDFSPLAAARRNEDGLEHDAVCRGSRGIFHERRHYAQTQALAPSLRLHLRISTAAVKWRGRFYFLCWLFVWRRGRSGMQNGAGGAPRRLPEL